MVAEDYPIARGQIWYADVGLGELKRCVVVSNNTRNRKLGDVLAVRLTSKDKPDLPSIVRFEDGEMAEPGRCHAVADDVWLLKKEWMDHAIGALTPSQLDRVSAALVAALDL